jgi:hypothetical protein
LTSRIVPVSYSNAFTYCFTISYTTFPGSFDVSARMVAMHSWPVSETGRTARVSTPSGIVWRQHVHIDTDPGERFDSAGVDPTRRA